MALELAVAARFDVTVGIVWLDGTIIAVERYRTKQIDSVVRTMCDDYAPDLITIEDQSGVPRLDLPSGDTCAVSLTLAMERLHCDSRQDLYEYVLPQHKSLHRFVRRTPAGDIATSDRRATLILLTAALGIAARHYTHFYDTTYSPAHQGRPTLPPAL